MAKKAARKSTVSPQAPPKNVEWFSVDIPGKTGEGYTPEEWLELRRLQAEENAKWPEAVNATVRPGGMWRLYESLEDGSPKPLANLNELREWIVYIRAFAIRIIVRRGQEYQILFTDKLKEHFTEAIFHAVEWLDHFGCGRHSRHAATSEDDARDQLSELLVIIDRHQDRAVETGPENPLAAFAEHDINAVRKAIQDAGGRKAEAKNVLALVRMRDERKGRILRALAAVNEFDGYSNKRQDL